MSVAYASHEPWQIVSCFIWNRDENGKFESSIDETKRNQLRMANLHECCSGLFALIKINGTMSGIQWTDYT